MVFGNLGDRECHEGKHQPPNWRYSLYRKLSAVAEIGVQGHPIGKQADTA